jgi:hypothetical protein
MLKANELRIGNWVAGTGMPCRVTAHDLYMMDFGKLIGEPIPLNADVLKNCKLESYGAQYSVRKVYSDDVYYHFFAAHNDGDVYADHDLGELKNVHQLQNIYFCLTGEELEIEL